ncbi:MAG TPA: universal stress protein [Longimicrobium sp.]|nr:universal stress protein [Longimicrobium sp.]
MSSSIRTIVVGVAGMDDQDPRTPGGADPVLGPAVKLAAALGAELHAVHAFEIPKDLSWVLTAGEASAKGSPGDAAWVYAAELEERLERQLAAIPGGDAVHCRAVEGSAADVVCRTAEEVEAELLVAGASRRGRQWSGILGSTASQLMAESRLPLLIVHRPFEGAVRRVLLTCDVSECASDVLRRGAAAARALTRGAAEMRCLHVVQLDPLFPLPLPAEAAETLAREALDRCLADAGLEPATVEACVRIGDPAREIAYEASEWHADLLVVGTHAKTGLEEHPVGRVAIGAVRGAPCNVLAIPTCAAVPEASRPADGWHGGEPVPNLPAAVA